MANKSISVGYAKIKDLSYYFIRMSAFLGNHTMFTIRFSCPTDITSMQN